MTHVAPGMVASDALVGVWWLESFTVHRASGEAFVWPGPQSGMLIYTACGHVSVAQNRQPLDNPSAADRSRVSNFYSGVYEADLPHGRVFHTALQSSVPAIIGVRAERSVSIDAGGRLTLSGVGLDERVTLVWQRAPRHAR